MLNLLSLKDFVIVPELTVEAEEGLTCLTGETGAGKSILIDALELVLGARSDTGLIREGAQRTEVSAEFSMTPRAKSWLENAGLDASDTILLRRTVDVKGRSRCWINGSPVTVAQSREIGERLVDIHGQHAHQSLLKPAFQLQLVDGFGGTRSLLLAVHAAWAAWQKAARRLKEATSDKDKLEAEAERLSWMNELLTELNPGPDEWKKISEEHAMLSNAADIVINVRSAIDNLTSGEANALSLLNQAQLELSQAGKFDPKYEELSQALEEASSIIDDCAHDVSRRLDRIDMDEDHFAQLDERLNAFWRMSRKFQRAPEDIYALWEQTQTRLSEIEQSADIDALERAEKKAKALFTEEAAKLTSARQAAAQKLSQAVTQEMQILAMAGGRLEIALPPSAPWAGGMEHCEFLVSGHAGATPRPLTKVASGGELARISLAIAVITAQITPVPTLIFDEVDSGIGGAVAEVVGKLLRRLGKSRQVLCVTHLPQVAACGNHQWRVEKHTENGRTESSLSPLSSDERVSEIARMLGGSVITEAARKTAAEMMAAAEH